MYTIKKYLLRPFLMTSLLLAVCIGVNAQRGGGGHSSGGSSGGGHSFSGGGGHSFSGGGGHSFSGGGNRSASYRSSSYSGARPAVGSRPASYNHTANYAGRPSYAGRVGYTGRPGYGYGARGYGVWGYGGRPYSYGFHGGYYYGYHGGYFYGPYGYYPFFPAFGFRLGFLPYGYSSFWWGADPYYYYNGIYYQSYGDEYEVVEPPLGASVTQLPAGAVPTVIDGQEYYEYHGTYYKEVASADNNLSYTIVGRDGVLNGVSGNTVTQQGGESAQQDNVPQQDNNAMPQPINKAGDKLSQLPDGAKTVVINQQKFYEDPAGTYYQEEVDGNKVIYIVVGQATAQ